MYCLLFYDVTVKRVQKVHRMLSKRMFWIQNSTFEGEMSQTQKRILTRDLTSMLDPEEDSLVFAWTEASNAWRKQLLGRDKGRVDIIA